jgi:hypothetical protein
VNTPSTTSSSHRVSFLPKSFEQQVKECRKKLQTTPNDVMKSFEYTRKTLAKPKTDEKLLRINRVNKTKPISKFSNGLLCTKFKAGAYGVIFNDRTEIIVSKDLFQFQVKCNIQTWQLLDFSEYPDKLNEKVSLIAYMLNLYRTKPVKLCTSRPSDFDEDFTSKTKKIDLKKIRIGKDFCLL